MPINNIVETTKPPTILDLQPTINLSADYFFVQGVVLLNSIPRGYSLGTVEHSKRYIKKYN